MKESDLGQGESFHTPASLGGPLAWVTSSVWPTVTPFQSVRRKAGCCLPFLILKSEFMGRS